jgi:uncharacterized membrane protein YkvA (DUF1232 family)
MDPITTILLASSAGFLGYIVGADRPCPKDWLGEDPTTDEEKIEKAIREFEPWAKRNVERLKQEHMGGLWEDYKTYSRDFAGTIIYLTPGLIDTIAAWYMMKDAETPITTRAIVAGSLLYFINPGDIIPDTIPFLGQLDDLGVLKAMLFAVASSLRPKHYELAKNWLEMQGFDIPFYEPMVPRISDHAQVFGP